MKSWAMSSTRLMSARLPWAGAKCRRNSTGISARCASCFFSLRRIIEAVQSDLATSILHIGGLISHIFVWRNISPQGFWKAWRDTVISAFMERQRRAYGQMVGDVDLGGNDRGNGEVGRREPHYRCI